MTAQESRSCALGKALGVRRWWAVLAVMAGLGGCVVNPVPTPAKSELGSTTAAPGDTDRGAVDSANKSDATLAGATDAASGAADTELAEDATPVNDASADGGSSDGASSDGASSDGASSGGDAAMVEVSF